MESPYIDVRGDGVFALFDYNKAHTALAAVVSFKTFVAKEFTPRVKDATGGLVIGGHYGIDCKTVLVRKMGLKSQAGARTGRTRSGLANRLIWPLSSRLGRPTIRSGCPTVFTRS